MAEPTNTPPGEDMKLVAALLTAEALCRSCSEAKNKVPRNPITAF